MKRLHSPLLILLCSLLVAAWLLSPLLTTGKWYVSHEWAAYPYRLSHFRSAFSAGFWYPRWMAEMYGGYGYPTFIFYQPAFFFLALPFTYILNTVQACYAAMLCLFMVGIVGAYKLARLWHSRWPALCFAIIFIVSPYIGDNLFIRGDLSELGAMLLCPAHAYFIFQLARHMRASQPSGWHAAGLVFTTALIITMHPFVAFWWMPFAVGLMITLAESPKWNRYICCVGLFCFALALTLTAPYWFTLLQLKDSVSYHEAINLYGGITQSLRPPVGLIGTEFVQLPWWLVTAGLLGFVTVRQWPLIYTGIFTVFYLFLMTTLARSIWELAGPILQYTQFSWRILAALTTMLYIGILQLGRLLQRIYIGHRTPVVHAILIGLAAESILFAMYQPFRLGWLTNASHQPPPLDVHEQSYIDPLTFNTATITNEFLPRTAARTLENRYGKSLPIAWIDLYARNTARELPDSSPYRIHLTVDVVYKKNLILNQLWFPGWKALINGKETPVNAAPGTGTAYISFDKPATYEVHAWYDGPPGWQVRNIVILVVSTILLWGVWRCLYRNQGV